MVAQILHTRDSDDGRDRERRTWHRASVVDALAFAATLPAGGNRRARIKIVDLDSGEIIRDDPPIDG